MGSIVWGRLTDRSGSITTGGTAQTVAAANMNRRYFFFQNISSETIWIDFNEDAVADQPSIKLSPGASIEFANAVPVDAVSIISATTGNKFVCKELVNS